MALIQCSECRREISDKAEKCIHCGCPIETKKYGKVIFQTSNEHIALLAKYVIKDEKGNNIASLKANDSFEVLINYNTRFFIRLTCGFAPFKEVYALADQITNFYIGTSDGGCSCYIEKT